MKAKKGGGQLQTKHLIRIVACKMCLFSLYFVKHMMFIILHALHALWNDWGPFCNNSALRKLDFRGRWSRGVGSIFSRGGGGGRSKCYFLKRLFLH